MPVEVANENLLFAVLALQNNFLDRNGLVEALNAWSLEKHRAIGELLVEKGKLAAADRNLLQQLVDRQLRNPPVAEASLAATFDSLGLAEPSSGLRDCDLRESLRSMIQVSLLPSAATARSGKVGSSTAGDPGDVTIDTPSRVAAGLDTGPVAPTSGSTARRFSVLRSHAKGGLGEVFVARDHELGREVALKEIQPKYSREPSAQQRFELEACITGGLEHPGVVPVYAFGHYPDGRPYYAMRFIRGDSLKEEITRFHAMPNSREQAGPRRLAFRNLLRRFIDTCNAIAYAHSRGVVHRDIKPANIMLGKFGETLVVDWGLAKSVGRDAHYQSGEEETLMPLSGSQNSATLHGSTIGTPAFMSPEQASGQIDSLGPASDIYSLGATLYSLLTGKLAFEGKSARAIVEQVKLNQFRPPLEIAPDLPRPLNAICLRAMATQPGDRFSTALELAAELDQWLADEPVKSYRETLIERTKRWFRRHRTLATAATVLLVTATVASVAGMLMLNAEQRRTAVERDRALTAEGTAKLATAAELAARKQTQAALNTVTDDFVGELMARQVALTGADRAFFESVIRQYSTLVETKAHSPEAIALQADGLVRIGNLRRRLGELDAATAAYQKAAGLWANLPEDAREADSGLRNRALAQANLGLVEAARGRDDQALVMFDAAAELLRKITDRPASTPEPAAAGQNPESTAPSSPDQRQQARLEIAQVSGNKANALTRLGRKEEAEQSYSEALNLLESDSAGGQDADVRRNRARLQISFGGFLSGLKGRDADAIPLFESALATLQKIGEASPDRKQREELGIAHKNFGVALARLGRIPESVQQLESAAKVQQSLVDEFPILSANRQELARSRFGLARVLANTGSASAAEQFASAVSDMDRLASQFPERPQFRRDLAEFLDVWGAWAQQNDPAAAAAAMSRALDLRTRLLADDAGNPALFDELFATEINFANFEREAGHWEMAAKLYRSLYERLATQPDAPSQVRRNIDFGLGDALVHIKAYAEALPCWQRLCENREDESWQVFELQRAICLTRTGQIDEGVKTAIELGTTGELPPVLHYDVACCLSVAAGTEGVSDEQRAAWLEQAMQFLEKAEAGGFFDDEMKQHTTTDPDLETLRQHEPFQKFCERLGIQAG